MKYTPDQPGPRHRGGCATAQVGYLCTSQKVQSAVCATIFSCCILKSTLAPALSSFMSNNTHVKTILILAANPTNTSRLRLDEEVREITAALKRAKNRSGFEIVIGWATRVEDLHRALLEYQPTIVHFSGHGDGSNGLALENNFGQVQLVSTKPLARLFGLFQDTISCVLLNACYSKDQAEAIHQHIDYVVGMNRAIGDVAAIKFATGFYDALGAGRRIEDCFEVGCTLLDLLKIPEDSTPVLKARRRRNKREITTNSEDDTSIDELVRQVRSKNNEKIQNRYGKIQLLNYKKIDIGRLYVDVYILERLSNRTYPTIEKLLEFHNVESDRLDLGQRKKRLPGIEVVKKYDKIMVLGRPGSGKSTFLKYLAIACCKGEFQAERIPVLIELRSITTFDKINILQLIHQKLKLVHESQTRRILNDGKVLLLLDGLDEVAEQWRQTVQDDITQFCEDFDRNQVILTCRTQSMKANMQDFEYVEVADFDRKQVKQFACNWFTTLAETSEEGIAQTENFVCKLNAPDNRQIAELATTPILLNLACLVFQDMQDIPKEWIDLYERGVELLLEFWDESRGIQREFRSPIYKELSSEDKQDLLGYIAVCKFKKEQFILFEQNEIEQYILEHLNSKISVLAERRDEVVTGTIDIPFPTKQNHLIIQQRQISDIESRQVLKSIEAQHGLLVERASKIFSFSHLTFQEYFAARWLCRTTNWQGMVSDITQQRWQEVLSMAFMRSDADRFAQAIKAEIDHIVKTDIEIQNFLIWLKTKSQLESVKASYKLTAIRSFYFDLIVIDPRIPDPRIPTHEYSLTHILDPNFDRDVTYTSKYAPYLSIDRELVRAKNFARSTIRNINSKIESGVNIPVTRCINHALQLASRAEDNDLHLKLQELSSQLPNIAIVNYETSVHWWEVKGIDWIEQLRKFINEERTFQCDWSFSEVQKKLLQQYYDSNRLLVKSLKQSKVSPEMKLEIEDTLLLPITEIKKHRRKNANSENS